jgi:1-acyl-sn-glycerol-3-phosphate acyltransferase
MSVLYRPSAALGRLLHPLVLRCRITGREYVPVAGPVVLAANHRSWLDPFVLMIACPRPIRFMAKQELFRGPFSKLFLRAQGAFPIRRGYPDRMALREALRLLERGEVVGMFPEGTRSRTAQIQPGQVGAIALAVQSGAWLLPVAIHGTEQVQAPWDLTRRPRVWVAFGEPYRPAVTSPSDNATLKTATQELMQRIAALLPQEAQATAEVP